MVAEFHIEECNGSGSGTWTNITTGKYCSEDVHSPGDDYALYVPDAGFNYSCWKSHRLVWTAPSVKITNIYWYTSGNIASSWALGTNGILLVGIRDSAPHGCPDGSYQEAIDTVFTDDGTGHAYYNDQTPGYADADSYITGVGNMLLVDDNEYTTATYPTGHHSFHIVTQVKCADDAAPGRRSNTTFYWVYDEV